MKPGKLLLSVPQTYSAGNRLPGREHFILALAKKFCWTQGAEIGVRTGRTLFHLLQNLPGLHMYAVDKDVSQFNLAAPALKYQSRLTILHGISWEMAHAVPDASLDFYFIDAGHGYRSVTRDIVAWTPKIKPGGWLLGHDINFPAVNSAVRDTLKHFEVGSDNVWFHCATGNYSQLQKLTSL